MSNNCQGFATTCHDLGTIRKRFKSFMFERFPLATSDINNSEVSSIIIIHIYHKAGSCVGSKQSIKRRNMKTLQDLKIIRRFQIKPPPQWSASHISSANELTVWKGNTHGVCPEYDVYYCLDINTVHPRMKDNQITKPGFPISYICILAMHSWALEGPFQNKKKVEGNSIAQEDWKNPGRSENIS